MKVNDDPIGWLQGFNADDPAGLAQSLREHLAAGDFTGILAVRARYAAWSAEREVRRRHGLTPEGVAQRQAKAAEHAAWAALIALGLSIVSLCIAVMALLKS